MYARLKHGTRGSYNRGTCPSIGRIITYNRKVKVPTAVKYAEAQHQQLKNAIKRAPANSIKDVLP